MTDPTVRPHRCGGCQERWSGASVCHCAACHRTFTGVGPFDYHRAGNQCRDPRTVKKPMLTDHLGRWGWPSAEGAMRSGAFRRAGADE